MGMVVRLERRVIGTLVNALRIARDQYQKHQQDLRFEQQSLQGPDDRIQAARKQYKKIESLFAEHEADVDAIIDLLQDAPLVTVTPALASPSTVLDDTRCRCAVCGQGFRRGLENTTVPEVAVGVCFACVQEGQ